MSSNPEKEPTTQDKIDQLTTMLERADFRQKVIVEVSNIPNTVPPKFKRWRKVGLVVGGIGVLIKAVYDVITAL